MIHSASLSQKFELNKVTDKIVLKVENFNAVVARIRINGKQAGDLFLQPYEIDITLFVKGGSNLIEVEIIASLRNLLGPHHHRGGDPASTFPDIFEDEFNWTNDYQFVPFGIGQVKVELFD